MDFITFKANTNLQVREELFDGRPHLVAPVIALVEGVHNGLFYSRENIEKIPEAWNGIPLPVQHPRDHAGAAVSCNDPAIIAQYSIGRFFNAHVDDGKLKGELWIDVEKAMEVQPAVLTAIRNGEQLEVSTGLWSDQDSVAGTWNEEQYGASVSNFKPDHLALLPGGKGACSWADGCGVRANQKEGGEAVHEKMSTEDKGTLSALFNKVKGWLTPNDASFNEIRHNLQKEVDKLDSSRFTHFVKDVYPDYFIYVAEAQTPGIQTMLYKAPYNINKDNEATSFDASTAVEVKARTEYVALEKSNNDNNIKTQGKKEESTMAKIMKDCCPDRVVALIGNEANAYTTEDSTWIENLDETQFARLEESVHEIPEVNDADAEAKAKADADEVKALEEQKAKADVNSKPVTAEEYIENAPEGIKDMLQDGMNTLDAKRASLVAGILANKANAFTENELKAMPTTQLEKMGNLASVKDYSANASGASTSPDENTEEALSVPGFDKKE